MSSLGLHPQPDEATLDLLIKQVIEGLSPAEKRALEALDGAITNKYLQEFERAAAAINLAGTARNTEFLPWPLQTRIAQQAAVFFAENKIVELKTSATAASSTDFFASRRGTLGWFAAAACLLLAMFGWLRTPQPQMSPIQADATIAVTPLGPPPVNLAPAKASLAQERAALLARTGSLTVSLDATKDPAAAGVSGDVVWDPVTQQGFLRFVGLRPNDPGTKQYQAWIFDAARDKRYPVDAGVFDVSANASEVIVPIHTALPILMPKAFAVTMEKPGGVVVSALKHVIALGAVT
jgi:Anti-sigma-K factor rskA